MVETDQANILKKNIYGGIYGEDSKAAHFTKHFQHQVGHHHLKSFHTLEDTFEAILKLETNTLPLPIVKNFSLIVFQLYSGGCNKLIKLH